MNHKNNRIEKAAELRKRAEKIATKKAAQSSENLENLPPEETRKMLHELRVHQIELEMQNEELLRSQAELESSRARYIDLYDLAPVSYVTLNEKGLILAANLTAANLLGVPRGTLVKPPLSNFIRKEDQDVYYSCLKQLLELDEPQSCELRIVKKDGTELWMNLVSTASQDTEGAIVCRVVMSDITERKRVEEVLQESEEQFRRMFMNAPMPYQSLDENGNFIEVNSTFLNAMGYSRNEVIGKNFGDFLHPNMVNHFKENFPRFKAVGEVLGVDFEMVKKDGSTVFVSFNGKIQRDDQGHFQRTHCIFQDITERKLAEEALRTSERRFRETLENVQLIALELDLEGRVVFCNDFLSHLMDWPTVEIVGQDWFNRFIPEDERESLLAIHRENIRTGTSFTHYENSIQTRNGELRFIRWSNTAVHGTDGGITGIVGLGEDITDRKQAEAAKVELETQNRQLQKVESLSRMAGAIAHRFNNQLAVVIGNLESTMEDLPKGELLSENLTEALKAARKAAEVSGLMLTYLGQTSGKKEPMDICEVCNRNLPLLRATLPEKIRIEAHFPSPGPTINVNEKQIQLVLTNLITNAAESYDDEGIVQLIVTTVWAESIPPRSYRYPIDWQPQDMAYACLEIRDTGCGIAEADKEKLFDPFFTTKFTGRGLGLAVVLGIIKAHQGAITVVSKSGQGSIFRVFLPVSAEVIARLPEIIVMTPTVEGSSTVLLVEDEEPVRKMSVAMLTRLGFMVLQAKDGVEALEVFRQHKDKIRWVLCDLTMPRMNGWETLSALRTLSPSLPVILASGHDEGRVMADDHPERPNAFLHKPFSRKELAEAIRKAGRCDFDNP